MKALKWKVVDEKLVFQAVTGFSVAQYIEKYGISSYCAREVAVLRDLLAEYQTRHIIVCSSSCVQTLGGCSLLREYLSILPIVHVMRDGVVLETYLKDKWNGNVAKLRRNQEPVFRSCSNMTFFNMDDSGLSHELFEVINPVIQRPTAISLSLKHVESDFLTFLGAVYGREDEHEQQKRELTYALQLPCRNFHHANLNLESIECCADLLQMQVDLLMEGYVTESNRQFWWEYITSQFAFLRRHSSSPIIYHVATGINSPRAAEVDYFDLLELGLRLGVEYMTVNLKTDEVRTQELIKQKGNCKVIGFFHDLNPMKTGGWRSQNRLAWYRRAQDLGCDIVQLTQPAVTLSDNDAAQSFIYRADMEGSISLSAYNTGRLGRPSQCFNKFLAPVRHPDITGDDSETITIPQAQAALYASFQSEPLHFYTVGANVSYSVGPVLHNPAFNIYGMPHSYSVLEAITPSDIETVLKAHHFGGLGLSSPFKTSIIPLLQSMSKEARSIGAVNTVIPVRMWESYPRNGQQREFSLPEQRNRAGPVSGLHGENTDWKGIRTCVLRHLSPANAITPRSVVLIIGAGGMARAAVYAMIRSDVKHIYIYNRSYQRAIDLVRHFEMVHQESYGHVERCNEQSQPLFPTISTVNSLNDPWPNNCHLPTIIINCTPVLNNNTGPGPDSPGVEPVVSVPAPLLRSPTGGTYLELAYNNSLPSPELLRICSDESRGWVGVTGLEIMIEVASAQFEFWTGRKAPTYLMKRKLGEFLKEKQHSLNS